MQESFTSLPPYLNPKVMLIASRALAAARPAIIAFLIANGVGLSNGIAHPISFCNILFIGNLCAAIMVGLWFGFGKIFQELKTLQMKTRVGLLLNGLLATALSTLIFLGLMETTVTNAILLGRLGPVIFAVMGAILLGKKILPMEWFGFSLIAVGVVAIAFKTSNYQINHGDVLILLSTLVFATSALTNKILVANVASLSVVVFSRNLISSVVFFAIAIKVFGPAHFGDAFSGQIWILMLIYSLIVIVFAQLLWYASTDRLDSKTIGQLTVISPIFGIIYAFFLNGERPTGIQVITLGLILTGVLITSLGKQKHPMPKTELMMQEPETAASAP